MCLGCALVPLQATTGAEEADVESRDRAAGDAAASAGDSPSHATRRRASRSLLVSAASAASTAARSVTTSSAPGAGVATIWSRVTASWRSAWR